MPLKTPLRTYFLHLSWLFPFAFFLAGYYTLNVVFSRSFLPTPAVVGLPLDIALSLISQRGLSARIVGHKEDLQVPALTILSQNPSPESSIRPGQTVFLVICAQEQLPKISSYTGLIEPALSKSLKEQRLRYHLYSVPSIYPQGSCIAQTPAPGTQATAVKELIVYKAAPPADITFLMPQLQARPVEEVVTFLENQHIPFTLFHSFPVPEDHSCTDCKVITQKPLAGSYIQKKNFPTVQLQVND